MNIFYGMTQSEALNMIDHMPDLTKEEFMELFDEAMKRPEERNYGKPAVSKQRSYIPMGKRLEILRQYLEVNPFVTRPEIVEVLGVDRGTADYIISHAKSTGLVVKIDKYNFRYCETR